MTKYAIIVAGGVGSRFGSKVPKQFLLLSGTPVLMHTINAFHNANHNTRIIVVLPDEQINYWKGLCSKYLFTTPHIITPGGTTRFESVKNGLSKIEDTQSIVAIHDGVRPLITKELIQKAFDVASIEGCAIPVVPVVESIRQIDANGKSHNLSRDTLRTVQTPQTFLTSEIISAYNLPYNPSYTDDSSVWEYSGRALTLISGDIRNIKITNPIDLTVADEYLNDNG